MQKTPRELNIAHDLAQQNIIFLKTHRYTFTPLNAVMRNWVQNTHSTNQNKLLKAS